MGQQQLLIIVIGLIIVALAVAVGITMFVDQAISSNRDSLSAELIGLASRARQYYRRPIALGGGGGSFEGLTPDQAGFSKLSAKPDNANGHFEIVAPGGTADAVMLKGVGMELVNSTDRVTLTAEVRPDTIIVVVVH